MRLLLGHPRVTTLSAVQQSSARRQAALEVIDTLSLEKVIASFEPGKEEHVLVIHHKWCPIFQTGVCGCAPAEPVFVQPPARV